MSVTFFAVDANRQELTPPGFEYQYEIDEMYGKIRTNENPLTMNVANGNFVSLLELLGLCSYNDPDIWCGQWNDGSLQAVKDKITFVLDSLKAMPALDGGTETQVSGGNGTCMIVECGLREGYYTLRLNSLLEIINAAIAANGSVVWS